MRKASRLMWWCCCFCADCTKMEWHTVHSTRFENRREPRKVVGSNDWFASGRGSYKSKFVSNLKSSYWLAHYV